eukprot:TRINITY_DN27989_c0_g1_i1.p1 TRINITY_DN27989_c0_g1~~TRINITY_DN27989_c0_g1_i1.p1  ORF type:complete len:268 (-),score=51.77 TRINITY_DN27989_c0_g1_i1:191-994(-)
MAQTAAAVPPRKRLRGKTAVLVSGQTSDVVSTTAAAPCDERLGRFVIKERHDEYVIIKDMLTGDMLTELFQYLKRKRPRQAKMKNSGEGESDDERKVRYDDRDSLVSWFEPSEDCPWLLERLKAAVRDVADIVFPVLRYSSDKKPLYEFEKTQYAVYRPGQFFGWHQDAFEDGSDLEDARQLSVVIMLTPASDYTGGEFVMKIKSPSGNPKRKVTRKRKLDAGEMILFPAKTLPHRVEAVKTGIRKTLTTWVNDPLSCKHGRREAGL